MISYEQYCNSVPYDEKILGTPDESEIKRFPLKLNFYDYHYIKYQNMITKVPMNTIISLAIANYVETCKNKE